MHTPANAKMSRIVTSYTGGEARWLINSIFFLRVHTNAVSAEHNYEKCTTF